MTRDKYGRADLRGRRSPRGCPTCCRMVVVLLWCSAVVFGADATDVRKEEVRACTPCHSLKIVHIQRLSATAWGKELDKMAGWGAQVKDRQALLDYLAEEYSDKNPPAEPEMSGDGTKSRQ